MTLKKNWMHILALLLACVLSIGLVACNDSPESTTPDANTTASSDESTTSSNQTTSSNADTPEPAPEPEENVAISVINGTLENSKTEGTYSEGEQITLTAAKPANGYRFTHWEDSEGNRLGSEKSLTVTVSTEETYKAYYEVYFGDNGGTQVLTVHHRSAAPSFPDGTAGTRGKWRPRRGYPAGRCATY